MQDMDVRGLLIQALIRSRYKAKKTGKTYAFRCPRHEDSHASAWLGDHAWGCSACGFTEGFASLADVLGVQLPERQTRGLTLADYAERKGLSVAFLQGLGVREEVGKYGDTILAIPYRDPSGALIRTKYRTPKGTFWGRDGEGAPLYGQDRLAASQPGDIILIVEGESDCHAAWQREVPAVGLPGASQWKTQYAELLRGKHVVVWQEPDEGGATLVALVAKDLPKAKVIREVMVEGQAVKDFADLHLICQANGLPFGEIWNRLLRDATPIGAEGPVVAFDALSGPVLEALKDEKLQPIDAVPTMLPLWNTLCRGGGGGQGLARGWFVSIGANTGTGKSLIALNLAAEAIRHGEVVTFLSLEMGRSELATRFMAIASGEPVNLLEQGPSFNPAAFDRASNYLDDVRATMGGYILVNRRPMSKLGEITQCLRYHAETSGSRYFIVDYLQLAWTQAGHSITERIELVAHQLRDEALKHNVTLVALSQFNRSTSAARAERPVAQGLMGGSAIENDSHQVLLFDHSRFERHGMTGRTWLIMDKNRHGPVEDMPVEWDYTTLRLNPRVPTTEEQEDSHGRLSRKGRL